LLLVTTPEMKPVFSAAATSTRDPAMANEAANAATRRPTPSCPALLRIDASLKKDQARKHENNDHLVVVSCFRACFTRNPTREIGLKL
jgi:hypothetical protein